MRTIVMLMFLFIAGPCNAEDPLETLNTVEDTLTTMERNLRNKAVEQGARKAYSNSTSARLRELPGKELYFASDEPLAALGWVTVRPCPSVQAAPAPQACAHVVGEAGGYYWETRAAVAGDLRPGVVVVGQQGKDGTWFMARVTDISELRSGYVAVSAPFKAPVNRLRIIEGS